MFKVASLQEIPANFAALGGGFYRAAHHVWELRRAEDGDGFELVRKKEEMAVDLKRVAEAETVIEAPLQRRAAARQAPKPRPASLCKAGQVIPVMLLDIGGDGMASLQGEGGELLEEPAEMVEPDGACEGCGCPNCPCECHSGFTPKMKSESPDEGRDDQSDDEMRDDQDGGRDSDRDSESASSREEPSDDSEKDWMSRAETILLQAQERRRQVDPRDMKRQADLDPTDVDFTSIVRYDGPDATIDTPDGPFEVKSRTTQFIVTNFGPNPEGKGLLFHMHPRGESRINMTATGEELASDFTLLEGKGMGNQRHREKSDPARVNRDTWEPPSDPEAPMPLGDWDTSDLTDAA